MRAVDTNVLVRLLTRDDAKQLVAAESFVAGGAWVSQLVLMGAIWVLESVYDVGRERIASGVEMLLDHQSLTIQDGEVVAAALVHHRKRTALAFSDCLILEVARKAGHLPLGTFDRELGKLEGTRKL